MILKDKQSLMKYSPMPRSSQRSYAKHEDKFSICISIFPFLLFPGGIRFLHIVRFPLLVALCQNLSCAAAFLSVFSRFASSRDFLHSAPRWLSVLTRVLRRVACDVLGSPFRFRFRFGFGVGFSGAGVKGGRWG